MPSTFLSWELIFERLKWESKRDVSVIIVSDIIFWGFPHTDIEKSKKAPK